VWKYINRERKEEGDEGTQMKEKQTAPEETEIIAEEVERQIRNLKKRKAPGRDGVQNEAWMYGTERMVERMVELMNGVWRGEGFPVDWRDGVICPIFKKAEKNRAENYRGITRGMWYVLGERMKRERSRKGSVAG
jgi:hypothetical protein